MLCRIECQLQTGNTYSFVKKSFTGWVWLNSVRHEICSPIFISSIFETICYLNNDVEEMMEWKTSVFVEQLSQIRPLQPSRRRVLPGQGRSLTLIRRRQSSRHRTTRGSRMSRRQRSCS